MFNGGRSGPLLPNRTDFPSFEEYRRLEALFESTRRRSSWQFGTHDVTQGAPGRAGAFRRAPPAVPSHAPARPGETWEHTVSTKDEGSGAHETNVTGAVVASRAKVDDVRVRAIEPSSVNIPRNRYSMTQ